VSASSIERSDGQAAVAQALALAGLNCPAPTVRFLHEGTLAEAYSVVGPGVDAILKIYVVDLRQAIASDPDRRFDVAAACFPIPPFFATTRERIAAFARVPNIRVPSVFAEGLLAGSTPFTLMERIDGSPWEPAADGDRAPAPLSEAIGRLLATLHATAQAPRVLVREPWPDAYRRILDCAADHVPERLVPAAGRGPLRDRFRAIVSRLAGLDLGPSVLAHGDMHPRNLLFGEDGRIEGIVDFGLACPGPAAMDFRWISQMNADAFLCGYGCGFAGPAEAAFLGDFYELMWDVLRTVVAARHVPRVESSAYWEHSARNLAMILAKLDGGPPP
jgi:aminoglycoside phosphotransferase (APT) family kinase protein